MHRFGRSAQQKMKDRWGGSFILATILALVGAWFAGDAISKWFGGSSNTASNPPGYSDVTGTGKGNTVNMAVEPQQFKLYMVQVSALRSEANAKAEVKKLIEKNFTAMVGPRNSAGLHPVYAGVYTDSKVAEEIKANLTTDKAKPFMVPVTVDHNTAAVPAAAMGTSGTDVKKGMELMNTYLHEVALWLENHSANIDTTGITHHAKELGDMATAMKETKDAKVKQFADLAARASAHATSMQTAMSGQLGTDQYQLAMTDYLSLLDQYRSFQSSK